MITASDVGAVHEIVSFPEVACLTVGAAGCSGKLFSVIDAVAALDHPVIPCKSDVVKTENEYLSPGVSPEQVAVIAVAPSATGGISPK